MKNIKLNPIVCYGLVGGLSYAAFHGHHDSHIPAGTTAQSLPLSLSLSDGTAQFSNNVAQPVQLSLDTFKGPVSFQTGAPTIEHPADIIGWLNSHGFTSEG